MPDQPQEIEATPLPGAGAAAGTPVPMDVNQSGKTSTYQSTQEVPSPQSAAALAELAAAGKTGVDTAQEVTNAKVDQQTDIANQQGTEADRLTGAATNAAADNQEFLDRIHGAQRLQQDDAQDLKDYGFHDFFHDKDGKRNVGRSILMGLGSLFAGGGGTDAAKAVAEQQNQAITRDFDLQRQQYSQEMDQRRMHGEDLNALYTEWERKNGASLYKESLARQAAAARAIEIATRSGIPLTVAEGNQFVVDQRKQAAQAALQSASHYDKHVQSGGTTESHKTETTGKPGQGPQITDKERAADSAQEQLLNDTLKMNTKPYTANEYDAIRRTLQESPSIGDRVSGFLHGDLPDYMRELTPEEQDHVTAALRALPTYAAQKLGPKGATNKTALNTMVLGLIDKDTDSDEARGRRKNVMLNTLKSQAETTPRPAYWRQKIDALTAPAALPAGQVGAPTGGPTSLTAAQSAALSGGYKPVQ